MSPHIRSLLGASLLLLVPTSAAAHEEYEPPPPEGRPFRPHLEASIAAQYALAVVGDRCARESEDVVGCTSIGLWAFDFAARFRLAPQWALGGLAQLGKGDATALIRVGAEARFHPLTSTVLDPWFGIDAGAAFLLDNVGSDSYTTAAPAFGASAGLDLTASESVSLGLLVRLVVLPMADPGTTFERRPRYDTQLLLSVGLSATYRWS